MQNLLQPDRVADHARRHGIQPLQPEHQPLGRSHALAQLENAMHALAQVERHGIEAELSRLDLGDVEHVVQNREQNLGGVRQGLNVAGLLFIEARSAQQVDHPEDAGDRRPHFVAHGGEKGGLGPVGGFRAPLGLLGRLARLDQRLCVVGGERIDRQLTPVDHHETAK